jgi:hypothetical protein
MDARSRAPWATEWTPRTALWNDAVRWVARALPPAPASATARPGTSTSLQVDLAAAGPTPESRLSAVLQRPAGTPSRIRLNESTPSVYTANVAALPAGSYELALSLPEAIGGPQLLRVDVPYATEYLPTGLGRSTLGQLVVQTGGSLLAPGNPGALTGDRRALRVPLLVLALVLFLTSVAARMLVRSQFRRA